jgi:seryl-tRNA synthetase
MHDIKAIRDNPELFDAGWARKGLAAQSPAILSLDARVRAAKQLRMDAEAARNAASRQIGAAKARRDEAEATRLMEEVARAKAQMDAAGPEEEAAQRALDALLASLPNLPDPGVPEGTDEAGNVEQHRSGTARQFNYPPKDHVVLGEGLGLMDFETAAKLSGARFVVLRGALARLERALGQFMLDHQTGRNGYQETSGPILVRDAAMFGTGQLPKFTEDQFSVADMAGRERKFDEAVPDFDARMQAAVAAGASPRAALAEAWSDAPTSEQLWLIPTAEVSLTNTVAGEILDEDTLPRRLTALTPCFRAEAGSAGRDTRGMIRQHQFWKVELVSITAPEASDAEHERMTRCAEEILEALELPYRRMLLCAGDMGFSARRTYDLEVWLPGQNDGAGAYREISSCSNCGDFQARRMGARSRVRGEKGTGFVHTLNGSGLAVGRTLIAVMENWQEEDGSITVPPVLRPYLGGLDRIAAG